MNDWHIRFKKQYNKLRLTHGLTQAQIAERMNVTPGTVNHWLNGRREPRSVADYENLARILKVTSKWLMHGEDSPPTYTEQTNKVPILEPKEIDIFLSDITYKPKKGEYIPIKNYCGDGSRCFAISVRDSGMEPRISIGDIVVIDPDRMPENSLYTAIDFKGNGLLSIGKVETVGPTLNLKMASKSFELPEDFTKIYRGGVVMIVVPLLTTP